MRKAFVALLGVVLALAVSPSPARADVVPPAGDCEKKKEGEACKDFSGQAGACGTISYTKTFTPPFPDAEPSTSQQSYFGCKAGAKPTATATSGGSGGSGKKCSVSVVGAGAEASRASCFAFALSALVVVLGIARRRR